VADALNPVSNIAVSGGCKERAWFGWPCDAEIERLRDAFADAPDPAERERLAEAVQARAYQIVTHVPIGQWVNPVAYRDNLVGLIPSPVPFFWNVEVR
ncbi:MAG TPA: ABC transporter substrate-binding protein, partial [Alphaproteobacteria bacterium]